MKSAIKLPTVQKTLTYEPGSVGGNNFKTEIYDPIRKEKYVIDMSPFSGTIVDEAQPPKVHTEVKKKKNRGGKGRPPKHAYCKLDPGISCEIRASPERLQCIRISAYTHAKRTGKIFKIRLKDNFLAIQRVS